MTDLPSRTTSVSTATRLMVMVENEMKALRISEAIGAVASRMRVIFMVSSRCLSPGSIVPLAPALADGWIPGTRPGMTSSAAIELRHDELAVAQRFGGGEATVGGAHDHVDQRV